MLPMNRSHLFICLLFVISMPSSAQQVADTLFNSVIKKPAYATGKGPVILVDEAHSNFHTVNGRFAPFANVLRKDGYVVHGSAQHFSSEQLSKGKILVVSNALHPSNLGSWTLPTPSAFTDEEINAVNRWVKEGGSLFLIADHMPFPGAAKNSRRHLDLNFTMALR